MTIYGSLSLESALYFQGVLFSGGTIFESIIYVLFISCIKDTSYVWLENEVKKWLFGSTGIMSLALRGKIRWLTLIYLSGNLQKI